jgi:glutaredoxin
MKLLNIFILVTFMLSLSGCGEQQKDYTKLAQCLNEKGVVMYGSITCPHCTKVKKAFGDAFKYMKYIECSPQADLEGAKKCMEDKVDKYPTFRFSDGTEALGEQTPEELALRVGCEATESPATETTTAGK